jgi:hypothetical protein
MAVKSYLSKFDELGMSLSVSINGGQSQIIPQRTEAEFQNWLNARPGRAESYQRAKAQMQKELTGKPAYARPKANNKRGIVWDGQSDCFDELVYSAKDGGVYASFIGPAPGVWFFPLSRSEAEDWLIDNGDAPGTYFNATGLRELGE